VAQGFLPVRRWLLLDRVHSQEWVCHTSCMKLSRHQVIGSVLLALIVLAVLVIRAWPVLFPK
jgi:hypothetical protein